MIWTPQQADALADVNAWLKDRDGPQVYRLFGYAGTGKTTLAKHLAESVGRVAFAAYTGKAALVLRRLGCPGAKTIHSLIYRPTSDDDGVGRGRPTFEICPASDAWHVDLIVIDECSMVGEEIGADLLSFGKKILVLGDPFQLPPIEGGGFFTNHAPHTMLTDVRRQARDNPVLELATRVRLGETLLAGTYGDSCVVDDLDLEELIESGDQLLVGRNVTRRSYNRGYRHHHNRRDALPLVDDVLVCLRNDHKIGVLNGEQFTALTDAKPAGKYGQLTIKGDEQTELEIKFHHQPFFGERVTLPWRQRRLAQEFDYGYTLTVHKSQGSQWQTVSLIDEWGAENHARWLYTGITRAQERVAVVR